MMESVGQLKTISVRILNSLRVERILRDMLDCTRYIVSGVSKDYALRLIIKGASSLELCRRRALLDAVMREGWNVMGVRTLLMLALEYLPMDREMVKVLLIRVLNDIENNFDSLIFVEEYLKELVNLAVKVFRLGEAREVLDRVLGLAERTSCWWLKAKILCYVAGGYGYVDSKKARKIIEEAMSLIRDNCRGESEFYYYCLLYTSPSPRDRG